MEFSIVDESVKEDGFVFIKDGFSVGKSANTEAVLDKLSPHGIITPRDEYFTIDGTDFYNYNFNDAAALGDCSHCFHPAATDSGARTVTTKNLTFDATVNKKIKYQYPFRGIFLDADGSLTGLGAKTWATANWKHNEQPECTKNVAVYDGIICPASQQVRRIAFHAMEPSHFSNMPMKFAQYDDATISKMSEEEKKTYLKTESNFSNVPFKAKLDPSSAWAMPFVTGHKYRAHWDQGQLDFTRMRIEVSNRWEETDKHVLFNMPFVDDREAVDFFGKYNGSYNADKDGALYYKNGSLTNNAESAWLSGYNVVDN
jgi:hypothetical protein